MSQLINPINQTQDIPLSANSITVVEGGIRPDPEGVASAGKVKLITWKDSRNANRAITLGSYLYQYDFSFDDGQKVVTRSANDDAYGHPGFGYVVSHNTQNGNSPLGKGNTPTKVETTVFSGGHHAIHRVEFIYDRDKEAGGLGIKIPVVIEWFVATGRDHPVWSVTWKTSEAIKPKNIDFNNYRMDVRGPYGSLNFDGAANRNQGDAIGGVAWGDFDLKFTTTSTPLTLKSSWTYNTPNTVCFTQAWTANENAEMGIVQTHIADKEMGYPDRVVGRERGHTSSENYLDKGNCVAWGGDNRSYTMPCISGWAYQLMNFDWDPTSGKPVNESTGTKLIAWGSPFGWLGAEQFDLFDYSATTDGRGDRSYATFIVLGPKLRLNPGNDQRGDVAIAIKAVEALNAATISNVNPGSLVTQVVKGPGATQMKTITHGYNDTYTAYYLKATDNQVSFTFAPGANTSIKNPIFVVQNYTAGQLPGISINNNPVIVNVGDNTGAFVSLNSATNELWVTLNKTISAAVDIQITGQNDQAPSDLQLSVDPGAATHPISPFIYGINAFGMNDAEFTALSQAITPSVVRWGGNSTTRYNWENDFYNTGRDYYYENIPANNPDRSQLPNNSTADRFVQRNKTAGSESLITVPLIGWVAKAKTGPNPLGHPFDCGFKVKKYGRQKSIDRYDHSCGNGIRSDGSFITGNEPTDTSIAVGPDFVGRWVTHLVGRFGNASAGGVRFYALDNEPGIWFQTHRDVFPGYLSYEDLLQRNIDYAAAIRQADPDAQILGPVQDGWTRYFYSSYDSYPDATAQADRDNHNDEAFVAWYLHQLYFHDQQRGQRTIDYFDLHYYPEEHNVALSSAGNDTTQKLRLESTRALWDADYVYNDGWIKGTEGGNTAVQLIPRMRAWVNQHYPGLKLSISEYNWGAIDDLNGALAQADILGIFGREDVGVAILWGAAAYDNQGNKLQPALTASHPVAFAFRMYQNYDGQESKFGDASIAATSADQEKLTIYAAQRSSDHALTLMIINKGDSELSAQIGLGGFAGQQVKHYLYSAANLHAIAKQTDLPITDGAIHATLTAKSINLLIVASSV